MEAGSMTCAEFPLICSGCVSLWGSAATSYECARAHRDSNNTATEKEQDTKTERDTHRHTSSGPQRPPQYLLNTHRHGKRRRRRRIHKRRHAHAHAHAHAHTYTISFTNFRNSNISSKYARQYQRSSHHSCTPTVAQLHDTNTRTHTHTHTQVPWCMDTL